MIGPLLILTGLYGLWIVFRGKSGPVWNALTGNDNFSTKLDNFANAKMPSKGGGGGGGGSKSSAPTSGNTTDSGTHMGIDASGNIITIDKPYGGMSGAEQDAANAYAHLIGNIG